MVKYFPAEEIRVRRGHPVVLDDGDRDRVGFITNRLPVDEDGVAREGIVEVIWPNGRFEHRTRRELSVAL